MPIGRVHSSVIRLVKGQRGKVAMRLHLALRFDYGITVPWVTRLEDKSGISAIAGPSQVVLRSTIALRGKNFATIAEFDVAEGECVPFLLTHSPSHESPPAALDWRAALHETESFWRGWSARCCYKGPWKEPVQRSLLTLKALTYKETGGIVAAPTTSLPEQLGGQRNWDYRYCWLRDATFTLMAFMSAGYREEAQSWRTWLQRSVAGTPSDVTDKIASPRPDALGQAEGPSGRCKQAIAHIKKDFVRQLPGQRLTRIACPRETAQPHALGAVVNFQVGKAHLKRMLKSRGYFFLLERSLVHVVAYAALPAATS